MPGTLVFVESNTSGTGRLFVDRARALGYDVLLLSRDPSRYGFVTADAVACLRVDTTRAEPVVAACAALGGDLAGVLTSSEYAVPVTAAAAAGLGLPGLDPAVAERVRDKPSQRRILAEAGIDDVRHALCRGPTDLRAAAARIGYPLVVKPRAASGSVAVRRADSEAQLLAAAEEARTRTGDDAVLVEELLPGREYSAEMFDGTVIGLTAKHLGPAPYFVETGHDFPAALDTDTAARIAGFATRATAALGLATGPAHVELRDDGARTRLIEANPRLAGGFIPRLVELATGIDLIAATILWAAGRPRSPVPDRSGASAIRFVMVPGAGRLRGPDFTAAKALPAVVETAAYRDPGSVVAPTGDFTDRIGHVIAVDPVAAGAAAEAALAQVRVGVDGAAACA